LQHDGSSLGVTLRIKEAQRSSQLPSGLSDDCDGGGGRGWGGSESGNGDRGYTFGSVGRLGRALLDERLAKHIAVGPGQIPAVNEHPVGEREGGRKSGRKGKGKVRRRETK